MKKKIIILAGGISKERKISIKTAKSVQGELKKNKFKSLIVDTKYEFLDKIRSYKPDVVFNALHGQFGEDGSIQTILELEGIKYTHSGPIASSLAMDKELSKLIFIKNKILTPRYIILKNDAYFHKKKLINQIVKKLGFPVVIKPTNEGSSVNVFICNKQNFLNKIKKLKFYDEILIEEFIGGREIQAAILGNRKLGAIELKPRRKFYDYKAKYSVSAKTEHIIPVDLTKKNYDRLMNISIKAHKLLGCKGVSRSDFKFYKNRFYLLETNTQPGMTNLSLVPEIARFCGMSFINLIRWIINDASIKR
ncbi:MAG: D-alanine--D-alanine ligase [Candidatus Pelagibacter sp. TMED166]|nr:MAG: D-alanine--D-alanine ligase [Candidatus Pelagibacter sp. TMED166]|tara:strand:- start:16281 stop:17201 length:921 start_codon:yes stop_codon:yes gene_type:complete